MASNGENVKVFNTAQYFVQHVLIGQRGAATGCCAYKLLRQQHNIQLDNWRVPCNVAWQIEAVDLGA